MTRTLFLGCALASAVALVAACSSTPPGDTGGATTPSAGTGSTQAGTGAGGTSAGTGGSAATGAGTDAGGTTSVAGTGVSGGTGGAAGGTGGSGGASGGTGGSGGMGGGGGMSAMTPPDGPFTCTQYIGAYLTMEWWNAGFEQHVDGDKWQLKWHHHAHLSEWRKADSPFWGNEGDPLNDSQGAPIQSACTTGSDAPDRVVFLAIDWELITEQDWVQALTESIANLKTHIPSARRVDIVTFVECPNDTMCNPNADYGPGANDSAGRQDCYDPPYVASAIDKVIAADPGYLAWGPKLQMAMCNPSHDGAHMTGEGNTQAAIDYGTYYAAHP